MQKIFSNDVAMTRIKRDEASTSDNFRIAFIADTHNYYDHLADLVRKINNNGPYAFIVVAGDVTNEGLREEYLKTNEILQRLESPFLVVAGNHDLLANGGNIYERLYGDLNFKLKFKDMTLVFLNNNNWESGGVVPDLDFAESSLMEAATSKKIMIMHVAPHDSDRFSQNEINTFQELMNMYDVEYILNGHNHNPGEGTFGEATQITIGSIAKRSYYELIITPGGITHKKVSF